jgi:hypothetical protein
MRRAREPRPELRRGRLARRGVALEVLADGGGLRHRVGLEHTARTPSGASSADSVRVSATTDAKAGAFPPVLGNAPREGVPVMVIPLISTFTLTPSTVLYHVDPESGEGAAATDVSLTFKFVVPIGPVEPYAGVTAGVTLSASLEPHVGGVLGLSLNLISNLDVFVQANYRLTISDEGNIGTLHIFAGPLFRFGQG